MSIHFPLSASPYRDRRRNRSKKKSRSLSVLDSALGVDSDFEIKIDCHPRKPENRNQVGYLIYNKAAVVYEIFSEQRAGVGPSKETTIALTFTDDLERRRSYSLAFAAKRYEAVLKDVLLDSAFYSSYHKLEAAHHSKVLVMLIDFYEHNFCFSDSSRKRLIEDTETPLPHILEIQKALMSHKVKLCASFARSRIQACALSIEGILPLEVKTRGECGAKHPLYVSINSLLTSKNSVISSLEEEGFRLVADISALQLVNYMFAFDEHFSELLVFSRDCKDFVYNSKKVSHFELIPQSKPRFVLAEIVRSILENIVDNKSALKGVLVDGSNLLMDACNVLVTHPELDILFAHPLVYNGKFIRSQFANSLKKRLGEQNVVVISKIMGDGLSEQLSSSHKFSEEAIQVPSLVALHIQFGVGGVSVLM